MKQCFVGKSRVDTPSWYTTDYQYKKYNKPQSTDATSKTERGMSETYLRPFKYLRWTISWKWWTVKRQWLFSLKSSIKEVWKFLMPYCMMFNFFPANNLLARLRLWKRPVFFHSLNHIFVFIIQFLHHRRWYFSKNLLNFFVLLF